MSGEVDSRASKPVDPKSFLDASHLLSTRYGGCPNPEQPCQRVSFGTPGHRGSAFDLMSHALGLLGISETSTDVRDLLARESKDIRAAEAVATFCYPAKKWIGAYAAALGGLDTLVFARGIGENASTIRERICNGLASLGVEPNESRNAKNAPLISTDGGRVAVRIIPTDEELMIARPVVRVLGFGASQVEER